MAALAAGNALEFYDFLVYAFFAAQIGHSFFPSADAGSSLLASLATFGAGFLMRPVGALVIGRLGDRVGRKPAMVLSFGLMGLAMTGLALTPARAAIGVAAPILAVGWRLIQGFALGGDVGPTTALMAEAAPEGRRGLYVALQACGQAVAVFSAGSIGFVLSRLMTPPALDAWGWRIAFVIGAAIVPLGIALRSRLIETHSLSDRGLAPPEKAGLTLSVLLSFAMLVGGTTVTYVLNYLTTYASVTLHMGAGVAFAASVVVGVCGAVGALVCGTLSDRYGRKIMMLVPACVLLLIALPAFWLIVHLHSAVALFAAAAVMAACNFGGFAVVVCAVAERLPGQIRSGALGLVYALAISVFGGSTQFVVAWLGQLTHNAMVPAWYMTAGLCVGIAAMLRFTETAPNHRAIKSD